MSRKKIHNPDLPRRLYFRSGKYFYGVSGEWTMLGSNRQEAVNTAKRLNQASAQARIDAIVTRRNASEELRQLIFDRDGYACVYCGAREALEMDHFIPVVMGGATSLRNLVVACSTCNSRKSDGDIADLLLKLHHFIERYLEATLPKRRRSRATAPQPKPEVADSLEVRLGLIAKFNKGEMTMKEVKEEIKRIRRCAKAAGQPTMCKSRRGKRRTKTTQLDQLLTTG